jgi:hypothetical protein
MGNFLKQQNGSSEGLLFLQVIQCFVRLFKRIGFCDHRGDLSLLYQSDDLEKFCFCEQNAIQLSKKGVKSPFDF